MGTEEKPDLKAISGRLTMNSFDLTAIYAVSSRLSLSLTVPFEHADYSTVQGDFQRHNGSAGGLGDLRLMANTWLLNPINHPDGNINIGLGVKFPTGDERATDDFHTGVNQVLIRPVDIAAQPGDGGWGAVLELQAFQKIVENFYAYLDGFYLINPRDTNGTERPSPAVSLVNTVPDQYFGRGGLSYAFWAEKGLSFSLGGRIDGIPVHDLIGDSNGFRRAGYVVYIDPGLNWAFGKNALSVNVPVALSRNLEPTKTATTGAFADYLVVATYSRRF